MEVGFRALTIFDQPNPNLRLGIDRVPKFNPFSHPRPETMRRAAAVHESGHAVAALVIFRAASWEWLPFDRVRLAGADKRLVDRRGVVVECDGILDRADLYSPRGGPFGAEPALFALMRRNAEWESIISFAGPMAEARFWGCPNSGDKALSLFFGGETDLAIVAGIEKDFPGLLIELLRQQSRRLVREHWAAIVRLATELDRRGEIAGNEIVEIVDLAATQAKRRASHHV